MRGYGATLDPGHVPLAPIKLEARRELPYKTRNRLCPASKKVDIATDNPYSGIGKKFKQIHAKLAFICKFYYECPLHNVRRPHAGAGHGSHGP